MRRFAAALAVLSLAAFLTACGGNKATTTNASTAPMTEGGRERAALPLSAAAPMPAGLNCGATKPVWVNLHTKAYHEPDSPYYGRTKSGQYMCPSAAVAAGYHGAGAGRNGSANGAAGAETGASPMAGESPMPGHRRHHRRSSSSY
jgi:hypothetical protein